MMRIFGAWKSFPLYLLPDLGTRHGLTQDGFIVTTRADVADVLDPMAARQQSARQEAWHVLVKEKVHSGCRQGEALLVA